MSGQTNRNSIGKYKRICHKQKRQSKQNKKKQKQVHIQCLYSLWKSLAVGVTHYKTLHHRIHIRVLCRLFHNSIDILLTCAFTTVNMIEPWNSLGCATTHQRSLIFQPSPQLIGTGHWTGPQPFYIRALNGLGPHWLPIVNTDQQVSFTFSCISS